MYHCVIRDIVTGDVLGDHMSDRMTKELVLNAIIAMLARHELAKGCIFHSDRGSQYTSKAVMGLLQQYGLRQNSLVLLEQVRTIDRSRLREYIGHLSEQQMQQVNEALAVSFGLDATLPEPQMSLSL